MLYIGILLWLLTYIPGISSMKLEESWNNYLEIRFNKFQTTNLATPLAQSSWKKISNVHLYASNPVIIMRIRMPTKKDYTLLQQIPNLVQRYIVEYTKDTHAFVLGCQYCQHHYHDNISMDHPSHDFHHLSLKRKVYQSLGHQSPKTNKNRPGRAQILVR